MKKHIKKILYFAVIAVLVAMFVYSAYSLIVYYVDSQRNTNTYENLAQMLGEADTDVVVSFGAGNIDAYCGAIAAELKKKA